jgi:pyruvate/2-oxoglutarate dehydrogenase complex dihydrolipoamide acyltransferase (E2) component
VSSSLTDRATVEVTMPQMGVSVAEGTIVAWHVAVGDAVTADQTVCEVSTDKIDTEVPAPAGGVVTELLVELEQTVAVGTVLARISTGETPSETPPAAPTEAATGAPRQAPTEAATRAPALMAGPAGAAEPERGRYYSPVVQRIAAERHVNLGRITGTGLNGRVSKRDVLAAADGDPRAAHPAAAPAATPASARGSSPAPSPALEPPMHTESPYRPEPEPEPAVSPAPSPVPQTGETAATESQTLTRMRRQIGEHMKRSQMTAATCTTWIEADMTAVESARAAARMTALPYVAAATVAALRTHPALNATLEGERYTVHSAVNLGIAVSLGEDGLIVPVVRDAHELSVEGLSARIRDLARRARARALSPDEVRGATFTITNPGQYGSIMATPVINQPQVAILDLEAIVKRPVVLSGADGADVIAIRSMTILGLSWDHRALDGVLSAQFLATLRQRIEATPPGPKAPGR